MRSWKRLRRNSGGILRSSSAITRIGPPPSRAAAISSSSNPSSGSSWARISSILKPSGANRPPKWFAVTSETCSVISLRCSRLKEWSSKTSNSCQHRPAWLVQRWLRRGKNPFRKKNQKNYCAPPRLPPYWRCIDTTVGGLFNATSVNAVRGICVTRGKRTRSVVLSDRSGLLLFWGYRSLFTTIFRRSTVAATSLCEVGEGRHRRTA